VSATCCYEDCGRPGATLRISAGRYAHPACFNRHDDEDQRQLFQAMGLPGFAPDLLEGGRAPEYRKSVPDRIGSTYGRWTIIGVEYRPGVRGKPIRCWVARCSCGRVQLQPTADFGKPGQRDAEKCGACTRREREQAKAPRYGGRLISELALEAGVSQVAIRWRIQKLGWRPDQLALPRGARRAPEGAPSARRAA
jgi:hypothetical protein